VRREEFVVTMIADLDVLPHFPNSKATVKAVGWLERGREFSTGAVADEFFAALVTLCVDPWQPAAAAGRYPCSFCRLTGGPASVAYRGMTVTMGAANVFVPASDCIYVAPSLIVHYVDTHEYRPPDVFQRAVMECPEMRSMAYLTQLRSHGFP
jgi:hypothetical protein